MSKLNEQGGKREGVTSDVPRKRSVGSDTRDKFLTALDSDDKAALRDLNAYLSGCTNPLPSATCEQLGLNPGSSYGDAVSAIERSWLAEASASPNPSKPD